MPFGGTNASDTFETGTRAAAWGGTTTIIDFAVQRYGERSRTAWPRGTRRPTGNCAIDYGFHQIIGGVDDDALAAMPSLIDEGITSFKLFMAYPGVFYSDDAPDPQSDAGRRGPGMLTMMHAENGPAIDVLAAQLVAQGKTAPYYHGIARAWQTGGGGDPPGDHDREPDRRAAVRRARERQAGRRADRGARDRGRTCSARRVRSTSTSRSRSSSGRARSGAVRGREVGVLDAAALARRAIRTTCGRRCARTTCRWSRPTTARSA